MQTTSSYSYQSQRTTNYGNQQTTVNSPAVLVNSGLTDRDGAKQVAKRILDTYDRDRNGVIDSIEVVPMIVDAYKSFNRVFSPSRADIESYLKILDRNGDGRVTIQDLEDLCTKYLTQKIWSMSIQISLILPTQTPLFSINAKSPVSSNLTDNESQIFLT